MKNGFRESLILQTECWQRTACICQYSMTSNSSLQELALSSIRWWVIVSVSVGVISVRLPHVADSLHGVGQRPCACESRSLFLQFLAHLRGQSWPGWLTVHVAQWLCWRHQANAGHWAGWGCYRGNGYSWSWRHWWHHGYAERSSHSVNLFVLSEWFRSHIFMQGSYSFKLPHLCG